MGVGISWESIHLSGGVVRLLIFKEIGKNDHFLIYYYSYDQLINPLA